MTTNKNSENLWIRTDTLSFKIEAEVQFENSGVSDPLKSTKTTQDQILQIPEDTQPSEFSLNEEVSDQSVLIQEQETRAFLKLDQEPDIKLFNKKLKLKILNIPQQMGFKIGDVAALLELQPYVLRFWEQMFDQLKPKKAPNKQRIYSAKDIETLLIIKELLYRFELSIEAAQKFYKEHKEDIKAELEKLKWMHQQKIALHQKISDLQIEINHYLFDLKKVKRAYD